MASAAVGDTPVTVDLAESATVNGQLTGTLGVENKTGAAFTLSGFRITPACPNPAAPGSSYCQRHADFGVLSVASAVGRTGTACAGAEFVARPQTVGFESFPLQTSDGTEIELAPAASPADPLSSCLVDVAFDILKSPQDADTAMAGTQTFLYAEVFKPGSFPPDFGTDEFTVEAASVPATVALQAPAAGSVGGPIAATATVTPSDPVPAGTVAFSLFGPDDTSCAGPPLATTPAAVVQADGTAAAEPFTPAAPGTYRWTAAYSGDATLGTASTACGDAGTTTLVAKATTTLGLVASPSVGPGQPIFATATLAGGTSPTGDITFRAWLNNLTCAGTPDFTSTATVTGAADYTSDHFASTVVGTYRFTASYSGDATNSVFETTCDAPGTKVAVVAPNTVAPTVTLASGSTKTSLDPPGGTFTFNLTITNTSDKPVTTKAITDSVYGDLVGRGTCKAGVELTAAPGPGNTYSCSYQGDFTGQAGASQKAIVKASALDADGNEAVASHDTTVTLTAAAVTTTSTTSTTTTTRPTAALVATPSGTAGSGSSSGTGGTLPRTGRDLVSQVALGLGLLLAGTVLTRRRRDRPESVSPPLTRPW